MKQTIITEYEMKDYNNLKDMTNGEVISCLEFVRRGCVPDYNFTGTQNDYENARLHYAIMKAIRIIKNSDKC